MPAMSFPGETALVQPRARGDWPGPHAHRLGRTTTASHEHENRNEAQNYAFGTDDARQPEMTTLADNGIAMMGALGGCRIFARTQKAIEQTGRNGASNNPPLLRFDIDRTKKDKKSDESKTDIGDKTKGEKGSDDDCEKRKDQKGKFRPGWTHDDDSSQQRREQKQAC